MNSSAEKKGIDRECPEQGRKLSYSTMEKFILFLNAKVSHKIAWKKARSRQKKILLLVFSSGWRQVLTKNPSTSHLLSYLLDPPLLYDSKESRKSIY